MLDNQDFVSLITTIIDFLAVSVVAISFVQSIAPSLKIMIRALMRLPSSFHYRPKLQPNPLSGGGIAKKNLVRGLLLALELEAANAILKLGVFMSFLSGSNLDETSSASFFNNFIFFVAVLSVRIGINQGLRRFDKNI